VAVEEHMHTHDRDGIYHNKLEANACYERASTNQGRKLWTSVTYTSSTIEISVQDKIKYSNY